MKTEIKIKKEVILTTMEVRAEVRYWEDSEINGVSDTENGDNVPCKDDDNWCPVIDIETGIIKNWENGKSAKIHYKVVDCCSWKVNTKEGDAVSVENDYVPAILSPKENGYGDYIIMDIDENGVIQEWNKYKILELLKQEEE